MPKISEFKQKATQGYIADIFDAVHKFENQVATERARPETCILQRTTKEYQRSSEIHKIKAVRGVSPRQDIPVKLPQNSEVLWVSKVYYDTRFSQISQANLCVFEQDKLQHKFVRIKSEGMKYGSTKAFEQIIVIPTVEGDTCMTVLIPRKNGPVKVNVENMHNLIKQELEDMKTDQFQDLQRVWLPQFAIGRESRLAMEKNNQILGYKIKIEDEKEPMQILEMQNQNTFQLSANPQSDGNLVFEPNEFYDDNLSYEQNEDLRHQSNGNLRINELLIKAEVFYVSMTHK